MLDHVFRDLAVNLSQNFGKQVTVTVSGPSGYDPSTRTATKSETDTDVYGVIGTYTVDQIGDQIHQNDFPVWVPARDITRPEPGDLIKVDDVRGRVVNVKAYYSGMQTALYEVQVRQ